MYFQRASTSLQGKLRKDLQHKNTELRCKQQAPGTPTTCKAATGMSQSNMPEWNKDSQLHFHMAWHAGKEWTPDLNISASCFHLNKFLRNRSNYSGVGVGGKGQRSYSKGVKPHSGLRGPPEVINLPAICSSVSWSAYIKKEEVYLSAQALMESSRVFPIILLILTFQKSLFEKKKSQPRETASH